MEKESVELEDGYLEYYPAFLSESEANEIFCKLMNLQNWKHEKIKIFGREVYQPRLTALFGNPGNSYKYSGITMKPDPFPDFLKEIKLKSEKLCRTEFNICLANLYRNGSDSMGWHADDEKELGSQPIIASLSLGEERIFHLKHKSKPAEKYKKRLQHGSLLIMKGTTQEFWKHQLPKTKKKVEPRINLTFRKIY